MACPGRTIRLIHEIGNKKGKTVIMRFGYPIVPEEMENIKDKKEPASFLRDKVYQTGAGKPEAA